jgi:hypothetical protein
LEGKSTKKLEEEKKTEGKGEGRKNNQSLFLRALVGGGGLHKEEENLQRGKRAFLSKKERSQLN